MVCVSECLASPCRSTFHGLGVGLAAALAHRVEELVHLLQREQVVQRLQLVDGRHHGASFKPCIVDSGETQTQTFAPPLLHHKARGRGAVASKPDARSLGTVGNGVNPNEDELNSQNVH